MLQTTAMLFLVEFSGLAAGSRRSEFEFIYFP
jgi:hypothetical protein